MDDTLVFTSLDRYEGVAGIITFLTYECTIRDALSRFLIPTEIKGDFVILDTLCKSGPGKYRFLACTVCADGTLDTDDIQILDKADYPGIEQIATELVRLHADPAVCKLCLND